MSSTLTKLVKQQQESLTAGYFFDTTSIAIVQKRYGLFDVMDTTKSWKQYLETKGYFKGNEMFTYIKKLERQGGPTYNIFEDIRKGNEKFNKQSIFDFLDDLQNTVNDNKTHECIIGIRTYFQNKSIHVADNSRKYIEGCWCFHNTC